MKRRILAALAAPVMAVSLAACQPTYDNGYGGGYYDHYHHYHVVHHYHVAHVYHYHH